MITTLISTPVSPDRVLAAALRLSLVPRVDHHRAIGELRALAHDEDAALTGALDRLQRDRGSGVPSRGAATVQALLEDTLMVVRAGSRQLAAVA